MGELGLQVLLETSPSPFFSACSCHLGHQFPLRSSVISLGPLTPQSLCVGPADGPGGGCCHRGSELGWGLHEAGMGWGISL